jgi:NAD+ synthase (glutamine-hydrolysing)
MPLFRFHVEICEDVWVPVPPSSFAALAGATVLVNLSASNVVVGKSGYRHQLVSQQSARCLAAYLYTSAGLGESTTDMAWDGQSLIYEKGDLLAESERFLRGLAPDLRRRRPGAPVARPHAHDHLRAVGARHAAEVANSACSSRLRSRCRSTKTLPLQRTSSASPTCRPTANGATSAAPRSTTSRCRPCCSACSSGHKKVVIGVSGGLDSTHALLVCAKAMDRLGLPRTNILAYTMPGFATSERTLRRRAS